MTINNEFRYNYIFLIHLSSHNIQNKKNFLIMNALNFYLNKIKNTRL